MNFINLVLLIKSFFYALLSLVAQMVKNLPACSTHVFDPWVGKTPWQRVWQPTLVILDRESHGHRSLAGYSPWSCKSQP